MIVRFEIAYDGRAFHGWQIQPNVRTVQGDVNLTLEKLLCTSVHTGGASRTDKGVHAMGQVVSFPYPESARPMSRHEMQRALSALMPEDIAVRRLEFITETDHRDRPFHARHCARGKRYRYHVWFGRIPHPFLRRTCWHIHKHPRDDGWVQSREAAALLVGTHDFNGFRSVECVAPDTVRRLDRVEWVQGQGGPHHYELVVVGTAFLRNMVRIIAGTLVDVAFGRLSTDQITEVLETGDRRRAGMTAPPHGLTLEEVFYPAFAWEQEPWTMPPGGP